MATIALPTNRRKLERYTTGDPIAFPSKAETKHFNRIAYAAAHVVSDPLAVAVNVRSIRMAFMVTKVAVFSF